MNVDVHDLAAAYAVDALDSDERRFFERHLADCDDCRGEVGGLQETGALLGVAAFEAPPAGMRDRVLSAVATTPQEQPARTAPAMPAMPELPAQEPSPVVAMQGARERLRRLLPAVAAVIVLGVAGVTVLVTQGGAPDPDDQIAELIAAPDARSIDLAAPAGASARVVWSEQHGQGVFLTDGLQAAPHDHAYALWVIEPDSAPALVGMFQPDDQGHASHTITDRVPEGLTVAVTVEVEDGVDAPTTDPLIVGSL